MTARGPKLASKTVTRSVTITTSAAFTAEELCKRLRLPAGTTLTVHAIKGQQVFDRAEPVLVAEWTVTR